MRIGHLGRRVNLEFREKQLADLNQFADIADTAEEQSSSGRALLLRLGIQIPPTRAELLKRIKLWECVDESKVVGHCWGDLVTGEILSLGVVKDYEGRGIGRTLLSLVVGRLSGESTKNLVGGACSLRPSRIRLLSSVGLAANRRKAGRRW